ncbi:MAG: peptidoglycan-associated lipoprotein Pal [Burkholderiaceae bacterium]|jgi:peptidoglycan-associated lipoprotein|nr:peptidoglycan-associated lipoprotein Pal [Burkholderiaceae bacterium]
MAIKHHLVQYAVLAALAAGLVSGCTSTKTRSTITPTAAVHPAHRKVTTINAVGEGVAGQTGINGSSSNYSNDRSVYFDFDSFVVKPEYQGVVDQEARYLRSHVASHVALEGNTDERGSREYNLALGQKRAEAVRHALVLEGVSDGQMEAVSFGAEKPADPGHDEAAYAKNRRVDFRPH